MRIISKKIALQFVILFGIVSLFADMTYEGARSITGQYLAVLGASGAAVGFVAGFGEFVGYGFRLISGYVSDRTKTYWLITWIGYSINLIVVPLLAFAGSFPVAASLIILERFGKAIRSPPKDAMLSYATKQIGRGFGFGLYEALDQVGAILGPLIVSMILLYQGSYQASFLVLTLPALCSLAILCMANIRFPHPRELESKSPKLATRTFSRTYWLFIVAISLVAAGYVDFALIAYHFHQYNVVSQASIPLFFSVAMVIDALGAFFFGRLYDKKGMNILVVITAISAFFVPFVFLGEWYLALFGMMLWGIGLGSRECIMRAVVARLVHPDRRAEGYGVLYAWFGLSWFLGSASMGVLYDLSPYWLVAFSLLFQLAAIPLLILVRKD
jgi:MFS family permease